MRKGVAGYMVHSQVDSPPATSTLLDPKKVRSLCMTLLLVSSTLRYLGWAPSTFVSSRSDRAKAKAARPEDFMDEEDLAELRESRKLVDENEEMDFGDTEAELRRRTGAEDSEKE